MVKKITYHALSFCVLTLPMAAAAQFTGAPTGTGLATTSITDFVTNIMKYLLGMIGILGVVGFVISGVMYLIAAGDNTLIDRAKKTMNFSIVGILVGLLGAIVVTAIQRALSGSRGI